MTDRTGRLTARVLGAAGLLLAAYYLTLGGEYSVFDIGQLRGLRAQAITRVDSIATEADSLRAWADSLEADPYAIERLAREEHGFIRDGERLFLFVGDESGGQ